MKSKKLKEENEIEYLEYDGDGIEWESEIYN